MRDCGEDLGVELLAGEGGLGDAVHGAVDDLLGGSGEIAVALLFAEERIGEVVELGDGDGALVKLGPLIDQVFIGVGGQLLEEDVGGEPGEEDGRGEGRRSSR